MENTNNIHLALFDDKYVFAFFDHSPTTLEHALVLNGMHGE